MLGSLFKPVGSLGLVLSHAPTVGIENTQIVLRVGLAQFSGPLKQAKGPAIIPCVKKFSTLMKCCLRFRILCQFFQLRKSPLRALIALTGSFFEPMERFVGILSYAIARCIGTPQVDLRIRKTLPGSLLIPVNGLGFINGHAVTIVVAKAQVILRFCMTQFGGFFKQRNCDVIILVFIVYLT